MKPARDNINRYAMAFEDCQTDIRAVIKRAFLEKRSYGETNEILSRIINKATQGVKIERLKRDSIVSLWNFANAQRQMWEQTQLDGESLVFLGLYITGKYPKDFSLFSIVNEMERVGGIVKYPLYIDPKSKGVPLQKYYKDVWEQNVKPTLERIANAKALDPNDFTGRNSLRNLAEMEVRYQGHLDDISNLRDKGVKLVVASSHADCSQRCAPWQGRIYSLDGTSGTIDGRRYVPLEEATDIYYRTKAGRVYKNGLLGFNCRHKITPYVGEMPQKISAKERKAEYAITKKQREMERVVRNAKAEALTYQGIDDKRAKEAKARARAVYKQYIEYSNKNNRAYYPMRTEI